MRVAGNDDLQSMVGPMVMYFCDVHFTLSLHFYLQVNRFCINGGLSGNINEYDEGLNHDRSSPNAQNIQCNMKSAWEILSQHSDFSKPHCVLITSIC